MLIINDKHTTNETISIQKCLKKHVYTYSHPLSNLNLQQIKKKIKYQYILLYNSTNFVILNTQVVITRHFLIIRRSFLVCTRYLPRHNEIFYRFYRLLTHNNVIFSRYFDMKKNCCPNVFPTYCLSHTNIVVTCINCN